MDDKKNEVVDYDGINLRIVHYALDNNIPYESSMPLDSFKDASGNLDDVKLIKAFNDDKAPLMFTPKAPIPADAVTASASGLDPHISPAFAESAGGACREGPRRRCDRSRATGRAIHRRAATGAFSASRASTCCA